MVNKIEKWESINGKSFDTKEEVVAEDIRYQEAQELEEIRCLLVIGSGKKRNE